ncbi:AMP-binding protein [Pseudomonas sp. M30-35]|uniref:AMP-binding protein n=1 Tax=Pseudomonas sp. M30-35 TaxID=1981174 RepID=UPI000B3CEA49|nr:AMP-binding protein [Pseudomonas sp. M30-35]ARU87932.1 AMP-dependent synthetase [Pseudomonas sp. M30-35]
MSQQLPLQCLEYRLATTPDKIWLSQPVAGHWQDISWYEADQQARQIAAALQAMDCQPGDRVGLLAKNCAQWFIADLAIMQAGLVSVPLYPLQSAQSIDYVLRHSQCKAIFLGNLDEPNKIEAGIPSEVIRIAMSQSNIKAQYQWDELLAQHQPISHVHQQQPNDLLSILYTSGTTGVSKGVMLTAQAFAYAGANVVAEMQIGADDQYFSYLPLSHAAERFMVEMSSLYSGGSVGFSESQETFSADMKHVRPTIFFSVPRLWTRFQMGVVAQLPQQKLERLLKLPIIGRLVASKIRKSLGLDRARFMVSGAAAIPQALLEWYQKLGMTICEGYAMTENFAYGTFNRLGQVRFGSVGRPMPGCELKISDAGEILFRSPCLMQGYYLEPEKTSETLQDGWLHTGDKGQVDADGYLRITGRVKDIFKSSKGKYIAPAPIEGVIAKNLLIEQVCLMGSNLDQPLALIELSSAARAQPRQQLEQALETVRVELNQQLQPHERVSHFILVREPWTVDNGCMTPTMKIRRNVLEERFSPEVLNLQAEQSLYWQQ